MKRGDFNFEWIFAIIIGISILILAVYGVMKLVENKTLEIDTETATKISILTNPLQAGFATASFAKMEFNQEIRIKNQCFPEGLGKNKISVSTKTLKEDWQEYGGEISVYNKYIFSEEVSEGEEFYVLSKSFEFPYEISDLLILTSKRYCFVNPLRDVEEELGGMNIPNIEIKNCSGDSIRICFNSGTKCSIIIHGDLNRGYIEKTENGEVVRMSYVGNLMYAAIFSDKDIYDCTVQRLLTRTSKIAGVFYEKTELLASRGCDSNLKTDLILFSSLTQNATTKDLTSLKQVADEMELKNNGEICGVW